MRRVPSRTVSGEAMKSPTADSDELLVHNWRVLQLTGLGIPWGVAETYADRVDWHQVAQLVKRGCPARLALRILR